MAASAAVLLLLLIAVAFVAASGGENGSSSPSPASPPPQPAPSPTGGAPSATLSPTASPAPLPPPVAGAYTLAEDIPGATFPSMVDLAVIPGTDGREAVIITQAGLMYRVSLTGAFQPAEYGDLRDRVAFGGEQGLLSLAFSPGFPSDGRLYVYYTTGSPAPSRLSRFQASASGLNPATEEVLLEIPQPYSNHNGGRLLFGPDGYLYLSTGDGGSGGDPQGNGQNVNSLLGKLLRLDVSGPSSYAAPPDNPFVGVGGLDEIFAYGFRNPWRFSFDKTTGQVWLGDVGQSSWEEVEPVVKGGNYGWNCYEGFDPFQPEGCPESGLQFPRAVYPLASGNCSVTGGYVYRGAAMPELTGWYVYADYCSGRIWAANTADSSDPVLLADTDLSIPSFAELPSGELLALTFNEAVYRLSR